ncbi:DNA alkylation repair protein [Ligaoa zhengdingensis]|uniref:DNA alkylation repair protein n=1 Tax=Ligaoa zhengdingensis TaxID=2763658 RepID=UPI0031BA7D89
MDKNEIAQRLRALAEPDYQRFASSLIPTIDPTTLLGVRLPALRKIAAELVREDWQSYLQTASDNTFEEIMLQGMVIGTVQLPLERIFPLIEAFLPKIDNWSVCDSFCSGLKIAREYPGQVWNFLQPFLSDQREYYLRFGVVMLLFYYIDESHLDAVLALLDAAQSDGYYAKMAVAWAVCSCYTAFPARTLAYLRTCRLDVVTYQKALQKILESNKVSRGDKAVIRAMKREIISQR